MHVNYFDKYENNPFHQNDIYISNIFSCKFTNQFTVAQMQIYPPERILIQIHHFF